MDTEIMRQLCSNPEYPTLPEAEAMFDGMSSVAITHDLIVYPQAECLGLVCRGIEVGELRKHNGTYVYEPEVPNSPLAQRVRFKLDKEGVLCHSA
jgi:hypothetical protein